LFAIVHAHAHSSGCFVFTVLLTDSMDRWLCNSLARELGNGSFASEVTLKTGIKTSGLRNKYWMRGIDEKHRTLSRERDDREEDYRLEKLLVGREAGCLTLARLSKRARKAITMNVSLGAVLIRNMILPKGQRCEENSAVVM
jgi:hypothetical protein